MSTYGWPHWALMLDPHIYFSSATKRLRPRYCIYIYITSFQYLCFMVLCKVAGKIVNIISLLPFLLSKKIKLYFKPMIICLVWRLVLWKARECNLRLALFEIKPFLRVSYFLASFTYAHTKFFTVMPFLITKRRANTKNKSLTCPTKWVLYPISNPFTPIGKRRVPIQTSN